MTTPTRREPPLERREPPLARLVGRRPNRSAAEAAKAVVDDVQRLLRAEIALAKAEVAEGVKAKAMGAGFFIGAAVVGWLAIQALLVWLGFLFALVMPAWAASGLVLLLLLVIIGVLGYLGMRKMKHEASLTETKASIEETKVETTAAVDRAKANAAEGVEQAKGTVMETVVDVRDRVMEKVEHLRGGGPPALGDGHRRELMAETTAGATGAVAASVTTRPEAGTPPEASSQVQITDDDLAAAEAVGDVPPEAPAISTFPSGRPHVTPVRPPSTPMPDDASSDQGDGIHFPDPPRSAEES